jgi:hypothetical protein
MATSPLHYARVTGILYLAIIAAGLFGEFAVRSSLLVAGDASTTAENILAAESLFRTGFAADAIMLLCDVAVAVLLYLLLEPVSRTLALLAAAFRLTQTAILGMNLLNYHAALLLLTGAEYAAGLETGQRYALMQLLLDMHGHGYDLGLLFFGLSNLVLGYLIIRADYIPGILGLGLAAAAVVYLAGGLARFLLPAYVSTLEPLYLIPLLAELSFGLWLVFRNKPGDMPGETGPDPGSR